MPAFDRASDVPVWSGLSLSRVETRFDPPGQAVV